MDKPKPISWFYENLPGEQLVEDAFKNIIKSNYSLSGFTIIDTPAIERVETLLSKGSDDNEIYWVKRLKADNVVDFDMWLRFDLTVPLARYVSQHEWNLSFPLKTQHIGKSWRGERPQKGRYREFYQADIDIIGNGNISLFADVEILSTIYNALNELNFWDFVIHINNKKILTGFLESLGIEKISETISAIDKKDKVKTIVPMLEKLSLENIQVEGILELLKISENQKGLEVLSFFDSIQNETLEEGISELTYIYSHLLSMWVPDHSIQINPAISRGLNYYTGLVFETFIVGHEGVWSISSGWRYENLCSNFSSSSFPGVGWSIGISRLLSILNSIWSVQADKKTITDILVLNTWNNLLTKNLDIVKSLRGYWIPTELYLDEKAKISKQLKYANNKKIPYVIIYGEQEDEKWIVQIKVLASWEQNEVKIWELTKNLFI